MISRHPQVREHLRTMKIYPVGESEVPGHATVINLASNESSTPPSEAVLEVLKATWNQAHRYSNNTCEAIISELAQVYGFPPENLVCGDGSAELIFLLAEAFTTHGDEIVVWKHGYLLYETAASRVGASIVRPESPRFIDVNTLLSAVTKRTKLVFLDNPNNPTGAYITGDELRKIRKELREDILLVIDAAYAEYVVAHNYEDGAFLVKEFDNVCMLRTFSKIYGLAGARLGWMYGPREIVTTIRILQQPSPVSTAAQYAAVSALSETDRVGTLREQNRALRNQFIKDILDLGIKSHPSEANFVLVDFLSEITAKKVFYKLKERGIIVRPMGSYRLESCLRVTIGTPEEMISLKNMLPFAIAEANHK